MTPQHRAVPRPIKPALKLSRLGLGAATIIVLFHGKELPAQPLTKQEVETEMKEDYFTTLMNSCRDAAADPSSVKLEIIIQKGGDAGLVSSNPAQGQGTADCLRKAVSTLKFRATGKKYRIVYTFVFHAPSIHGDTGKFPKGPSAHAATTSVPREFWAPLYWKGKKLLISGGALAGGSIAPLILTGLYCLFDLFICIGSYGSTCGPFPSRKDMMIQGIVSGVLMAIALPLLIAGGVLKTKAGKIKKGLIPAS